MGYFYGYRLMTEAIKEADGKTAINVGEKRGRASQKMLDNGFSVTAFSFNDSKVEHKDYAHRKERFEDAQVDPVDLLWCSMTIEHLPNVGAFLTKCRGSLKEGGVLAIVAPSDRNEILVDGHLTFWTPAHLIYNLVIAGWDCSEARWYTEWRDIALLVRRKDRPFVELNYDTHDLEALREYFPVPFIHRETDPWLPDNF